MATLTVQPPMDPLEDPEDFFPRRRKTRNVLPYLLILPAAIAELLIHIIPMALGVYISFVQLNQISIRNWLTAPSSGCRTTSTA